MSKYRLHYSSADDTNEALVEMTDEEAMIVKRVLECSSAKFICRHSRSFRKNLRLN